ncbi:MAG: putative bifunctional diguanylate cyclase/phosphodiesterase [Actinomycetota bacterium]
MSVSLASYLRFYSRPQSPADRLPTFAVPILVLAVVLLVLGILAEWGSSCLMVLAILAVSSLLPAIAVPMAMVAWVSLDLMGMLPIGDELGIVTGIALVGVVVVGSLVNRFLRQVEWWLAERTALLTLTVAGTAATPETVIGQTLSLIRDLTSADAAIALRQLDEVTAEAVACLPKAALPCKLTTPKVFAEALEKHCCLYYSNYPATPGAARTLVASGTQSLVVLPIEHAVGSEVVRGAILLIWYHSVVLSPEMQHFLESLLGELRTLLQFQDATFHLDKLQIRLSTILETIPQGVVFVDESGEQGWINQAAARQLNLKTGAVTPIAIAQAMAKLRLCADNHDALATQGGQLFATPNAEVRNWQWIFSQPQSKVLSISSTPTRVRDVPGRLWIIDDITDQYFLQQAVVERSQELSQALEELKEAAIEQSRLYEQLAEVNQELENLATQDGLTHIANRRYFDQYLEQVWRQSTRSQSPLSLILVDVDFFKRYNDTYGHPAGDECLKQVARLLSSVVKREGDLVARYGGEEFVILLPYTDLQGATCVARQMQLALLEKKVSHTGSPINQYVTLSMGIASLIPNYNASPATLIAAADGALYQAKKAGRDRYVIFEARMHAQAAALMQLENDLRRAVEHEEFRLHYQPIISLASGEITGFEALVRWQHPERGLISPVEFIPIAEETGLIEPLGWWVLSTACHQLRKWQLRFPSNPPLTMSVNFAGQQLEQEGLLEQLSRMLQEVGISGSSVKLEITESFLLESKAASVAMLKQLKTLGLQLAIDDFGTGYSSLSRLHQFPIDTLKIDRSFVGKIGDDKKSSAIVEAIIMLAHTLNITVVAEGVETVNQLAELESLNCEYGQGYLFSKPISSEAVFQLLASKYKLPQAR